MMYHMTLYGRLEYDIVFVCVFECGFRGRLMGHDLSDDLIIRMNSLYVFNE